MLLPNEFARIVGSLPRRSVIHVGAHFAEEASYYHQVGAEVLWVEANPDLCQQITARINRFPNQRLAMALLSDAADQEIDFNVANNTHCSSILPLKDHAEIYPDFKYVGKVRLKTTTLDAISALLPQANILNLDVQGAEGLVLAGGQQILEQVDVIYTEINFREMYEGCPLAITLDAIMASHGFFRELTIDTDKGWGDAIYTKGAK